MLIVLGDLITWGWNHAGQLACGKIGGHSGNPSGTGIKKQFLMVSSQYNFAVGITCISCVLTI